jgi:hypothetical protein
MKVLVLVALWFGGTFYFKICIDFSQKQLSTMGYSAAPKSLSCLDIKKKKEVLLQMLRPIHQKLRIRHDRMIVCAPVPLTMVQKN